MTRLAWRSLPPRASTRFRASFRKISLRVSRHLGSVSGKRRPMSPRPKAARRASVRAWRAASPSEWALAPKGLGRRRPQR
jgi:hypothetical protein